MAVRRPTLSPSGTLAVGEKARVLRAAGRTVFNLSGGARDSGPPFGLTLPTISADANALGKPCSAGERHIRLNLVGPFPAILEGVQALRRGPPG